MKKLKNGFTFNGTEGRLTKVNSCLFEHPVKSVVYDGTKLNGGIPLGGLGTGFIELTGSGLFGETSIFNEFVPPCNLNWPPFTLKSNNKTCVLALNQPDGNTKKINYWGHFPFAELEYKTALPLKIFLKAFTPFVLGDSKDSNIPAVSFEFSLKNSSKKTIKGDLSFGFPIRKVEIASEKELINIDGWRGILISEDNNAGFSIGVKSSSNKIANSLSKTGKQKVSLSVPFNLKPGETKSISFILIWSYPYFKDSSSEPHTHAYYRSFKNIQDVFNYFIRNKDALEKRTLDWQRMIFNNEEKWPAWLPNTLVNSLYSYARNSLWVISERQDNWYDKTGFFTHSESFTGCPITETMVCRMHGHFPTLFFFPELEKSTLHAFKHFQLKDGEIPFSFGTPYSLRDPRYHCQHPLNGAQYVQMVYRYYLRTGDKKFLKGYFTSIRQAIYYQQKTLDYDQDGLVNDHSHALPGEYWPANQFYDIWPWYGTSAYVAGTGLAALVCAREIAQRLNQKNFKKECETWLKKGLESYNNKLWTGKYYRLYNDPERNLKSDICLANQLMGLWSTRILGLRDWLPEDKIKKSLRSIKKLNFKTTKIGFINGVRPDGKPEITMSGNENDHASQVFVGENSCAAMTFIMYGYKNIGLKAAEKIYKAVIETHRTPWRQHCIISGKDGHPVWGRDYYSNMVVWAFPLVFASENLPNLTLCFPPDFPLPPVR